MGFTLGGVRKSFVLSREDWMLLSITAARRSLLPIQLQRTLYLIGQKFPDLTGSTFYKFRTISSGQFSEAVYSDADALAKKGLVSIDVSEESQRGFRATPGGLERAKTLEKQLSPEVDQFVRRTVSWVSTRSVEQLVRGPIEPANPVVLIPRKPNAAQRR